MITVELVTWSGTEVQTWVHESVDGAWARVASLLTKYEAIVEEYKWDPLHREYNRAVVANGHNCKVIVRMVRDVRD